MSFEHAITFDKEVVHTSLLIRTYGNSSIGKNDLQKLQNLAKALVNLCKPRPKTYKEWEKLVENTKQRIWWRKKKKTPQI